jgi:hypothetical protein
VIQHYDIECGDRTVVLEIQQECELSYISDLNIFGCEDMKRDVHRDGLLYCFNLSRSSILRDIVPIFEDGIVKDFSLIFSWSTSCEVPIPLEEIQFHWSDYIVNASHGHKIYGASTMLQVIDFKNANIDTIDTIDCRYPKLIELARKNLVLLRLRYDCKDNIMSILQLLQEGDHIEITHHIKIHGNHHHEIYHYGGFSQSRIVIGFEDKERGYDHLFKPYRPCNHEWEDDIETLVATEISKSMRYRRRQFKNMRINCLIDYKQHHLFLISAERIPGQTSEFELVERVSRAMSDDIIIEKEIMQKNMQRFDVPFHISSLNVIM